MSAVTTECPHQHQHNQSPESGWESALPPSLQIVPRFICVDDEPAAHGGKDLDGNPGTITALGILGARAGIWLHGVP